MIKFKSDEKGTYAQWGTSGKKFYYPCGDIKKKDKAKIKQTKLSRESCVEAMRVKVGQYMRLGTLTLEQTQDFYTNVYQYIIWFNEANKPDFKQWLFNEVGSPYENNGFTQMPYFSEQMRNDLLDIYNGNY